jgi:hypothetical protein
MPGLVLAGSWTDTGWPDTREGAVRSGLNAVLALREGLARTPGTNAHMSGIVEDAVSEVTNAKVNTADSGKEVRS